jgi:hypothetical protein
MLNQIFYAPLRAMRVEPFLAVQLTFMSLSLMGGIAFASLLIRFLGVRPWLAIGTAAILPSGTVCTSRPDIRKICLIAG